MTIPVPGLVALKLCSSIHPLNTDPKPPSPKTLSGRKFLVQVLRSLKEKHLKLGDCKISPSLRLPPCDDEATLLQGTLPFASLPVFSNLTKQTCQQPNSKASNHPFHSLTHSPCPTVFFFCAFPFTFPFAFDQQVPILNFQWWLLVKIW